MRMCRRTNGIKEFIFGMAISLCSWPRLLIEVILRRDMGSRYFSSSACVMIAVVMLCMPFGMNNIGFYREEDRSFWMTIIRNMSCYIFTVVFLYCAWQRRKEIKSKPTMDFKHFSLAVGESIFGGGYAPNKTVYTIYEPFAYIVVGAALCIFKQMLGPVFIIVAVIHSLSYFGSYYLATNAIMDRIDQWILQQEFPRAYKDELKISDTRGFQAFGDRPNDPEICDPISGIMFDDEGYDVV